jgi:hypothetical protein
MVTMVACTVLPDQFRRVSKSFTPATLDGDGYILSLTQPFHSKALRAAGDDDDDTDPLRWQKMGLDKRKV